MGLKHKITTRHIGGEPPPTRIYRSLIRHTIQMTLKAESVDMPCAVNVLITDDEGIRSYNSQYRGEGKATDVLSFPMQEFVQEGWRGIKDMDIDLDTQTLPLGDIVISTATIKRHARKYKHTFEQETIRMIIHSTLHLLGYDHNYIMEEKEERLMRMFGCDQSEYGYGVL